jgi:hypothetical protein
MQTDAPPELKVTDQDMARLDHSRYLRMRPQNSLGKSTDFENNELDDLVNSLQELVTLTGATGGYG